MIHLTLLELPAYLDQNQACRYIHAYADHFGLNHQWSSRQQSNGFNGTRNWRSGKISVSSERGEEISNFDKIVICTSLNIKPRTPHFEGAEKFEGKVIHAQAFRRSVHVGMAETH